MRQSFIVTPFATSGDQTAFPIGVDPSNLVSWTDGWTDLYSRDQSTDPTAQAITRVSMNYVLNVITTVLNAWQTESTPEWIDSADNQGAPFAYNAGAHVLYSASGNPPFTRYVSLVAGNTATPGSDPTKWQAAIEIESTLAQALAGTDDTTVMTPHRVTSAILNLARAFNAYGTLAAGAALTVANCGEMLEYTGAAGTVTLPQWSTLGTGQTIRIRNVGTGTMTLEHFTGDTLEYNGQSVASVAVPVNTDIEIGATSTANTMGVVGGSATIQSSALSPFVGMIDYLTGKSTSATGASWTVRNIVLGDSTGPKSIASGQTVAFSATAAAGAGGIDTGTVTASSTIAVYMIFNPTTNTYNSLGTIITGSATVSAYYSGTHMPVGFTQSALVGVISSNTTASTIVSFRQKDRRVQCHSITGATISSAIGQSALGFPASIPACSRSVAMYSTLQLNGAGQASPSINAVASVTGDVDANLGNIQHASTLGFTIAGPTATPTFLIFPQVSWIDTPVAGLVYYTVTANGNGTFSLSLIFTGYEF